MVRCILFLLCFCMFSASVEAADSSILKVRVGQHGDKTRVVLESSKPIKPKVFTLSSPHRVVLDFGNVKFKGSLSQVVYPENSLVNKMRQGLFKPKKVRMVFDVRRPVKTVVFSIPKSRGKNHRFVIDLLPTKVFVKKTPVIKNAPKRMQAPVVRKRPERTVNDPVVVVIDPGHGGVDPGAIGRKKTYEKHITLSVAKRLQRQINALSGFKAYLTREKDIYIKLASRVKKAHQKRADIFVSLHADAHKSRKVRGGSIYVLSQKSSDKEAARLAKDANQGDIIAGVDLQHERKDVRDILISLAQRETMNKSALLGQEVLIRMKKVTKMRKSKIMFAGFRVLKAPEIPSILVEMAYLSNPAEEKKLRTRSQQERIAKSIADGIKAYAKKHINY